MSYSLRASLAETARRANFICIRKSYGLEYELRNSRSYSAPPAPPKLDKGARNPPDPPQPFGSPDKTQDLMCRFGSENTRPTGGRQEHVPNPTCPQAGAAGKGLSYLIDTTDRQIDADRHPSPLSRDASPTLYSNSTGSVQYLSTNASPWRAASMARSRAFHARAQ